MEGVIVSDAHQWAQALPAKASRCACERCGATAPQSALPLGGCAPRLERASSGWRPMRCEEGAIHVSQLEPGNRVGLAIETPEGPRHALLLADPAKLAEGIATLRSWARGA